MHLLPAAALGGTPKLAWAVWGLPFLLACHIAEELAGNLPAWVRRYGRPDYTLRYYKKIHALALLASLGYASALFLWPGRLTVVIFMALGAGQMSFNLVFHLGASWRTRSYCPGLFTAFAFPAYYLLVSRLTHHVGLWNWPGEVLCLAAAGTIQYLDISRNVLGTRRWAPGRR